MIFLEMDIASLVLGQAIPIDSAAVATAAPDPGFAEVLTDVQSGAPPGVPPPIATTTVGEEVAIIGPTAQTLNPDFLPQDPTNVQISPSDEPKLDDKAKIATDANVLVIAIAAQNGSAFEMPAIPAPPVSTPNPEAAPAAAGRPIIYPVYTDRMKWVKDGMPQTMKGSEICVIPPELTDSEIAAASNTKKVDVPFSLGIPTVDLDLSDVTKIETFGATIAPDDLAAVATDTQPVDATVAETEATANIKQIDKVWNPIDANTKELELKYLANQPPAERPIKLEAKNEKTSGRVEAVDQAAQTTPATEKGVSATTKADSGVIKVEEKAHIRKEAVTSDSEDLSVDSALDAGSSKSSTTAEPVPVKLDAKVETSTDKAANVRTEAPIDRKQMHLVVRQLADRMELLAATRPKNGVTIQLQPEDLGNVVMTIKNLGGAVEAHISASDDRVRSALEQNGSMLVQAMDQRGIKVESVTVSAQAQQQQQQASTPQRDAQQQAQQQQAQQARNQNSSGFSGGSNTTHRSTHEARQAVRNFSGVDYWI